MLDADLGFLISKLLPANRILTDGLYANDHFFKKKYRMDCNDS